MPAGMRRPLRATLLLLAACSGGSKHGPTTGGGGDDDDAVDVPDTKPDPALAARTAYADPGGMWLPRQMDLPQHLANFEAMGVAIDAKKLTDPLSAPLGAIVSLDICTGSFVSPDGLIITNHHCVQGALQQNTTEANNLVENGFLAKTQAEEISAGPSQRVMVEQAFRDVTADVTDGLDKIKDGKKRRLAVEDRVKKLVAACEKDRPDIECTVNRYFRGAEYQLIESLEIRDVRLVYVPHRAVGNFGGEVDNWHWPRHTGDFSFYRAYVGKDGQPAAYSPDNVPYHPAHWLKVAKEPLREHDFVMVAGYPGSTERLHGYSEVKHDVDFTYPYLIEYLQQYYDLLGTLETAGGETGIKAGVTKQFIQNALANFQGKLTGLTESKLLDEKKALDDKIRAWVEEPGREDAAAAVDELERLLAEDRKTARADFDYGVAVGGSSLLGEASFFVRMAEERPKKDAARKPGFQDRDMPQLEAGQQGFAQQYDATMDKAVFTLGLRRALALPADQRPWLPILIGAKKGAKIDEKMIVAAVDKMYAASKLTDLKVRMQLLQKGTMKQLKASKDPFIKVALALRPLDKKHEDRGDKLSGDLMLVAPQYAIAMREVLGGFLAPDANSTLRVTYGTVKPFVAGEPAFTRASEITQKNTGAEPFDAPKAELAALAAKTWGPYADPTLGEVPVDFLSDLDITGGNSGSPTLNDKGELVGLAFDGTLAGVASDIVFDGNVTRTIHADIRYALWVMDSIDGADNVLAELGFKPAL
jgi:hypothetical protein